MTTVEDLLGMNVVPVFNENDAISKGVVKATVSPNQHTALLVLRCFFYIRACGAKCLHLS